MFYPAGCGNAQCEPMRIWFEESVLESIGYENFMRRAGPIRAAKMGAAGLPLERLISSAQALLRAA